MAITNPLFGSNSEKSLLLSGQGVSGERKSITGIL